MSKEDDEVLNPLIKEYEPPASLADRISQRVRTFLYGDPPRPLMVRLREWSSGQNALLAFYLLLVVLVGTGNRVTFRLMQYSLVNYSYFVSQLTTFIYVPVSFAIIYYKFKFTKDITPEMVAFPKYKFAVMGLLDSLQGLLITVGGNYIPGIMQNLLMQGVVPVTMLTSLFFLRPRGCSQCQKLTTLLKPVAHRVQQKSTLPKNCTDDKCLARLVVNGREILGWEKVEEKSPSSVEYFISKLGADEHTEIIALTSARPWGTHFKIFYSPTQYLGAAIILAGLVVSVWPALKGSGGGAIQWDLVFFAATVPTALSGVYKEIAFREVEDMDVWYLNGWVALYQFYLGLFYAPLAAKMAEIDIVDIPKNLWNGFLCFLLGRNFITGDCSIDPTCGGPDLVCCDSCDGSIGTVSQLPAIAGVILYMAFNLTYNILLVLVIKYGSAALMYVASTIVLPLGSVGFTISPIMGHHATPFDQYNGAGLGIVLLGLIIYRFFAFKKTDAPYTMSEDTPQTDLFDGNAKTNKNSTASPSYPLTSPVESK